MEAALPVASAVRSGSGPIAGHLGASYFKSRRGKPARHRVAWRSLGGVIKRDFCSARAEPRLRRQKPSLASLARFADWSGVGIFVRGCGRAEDGSLAELFRNDASPSRGNGLALWIGIGGYWQRILLEFWLNQQSGASPASHGRRSRRRPSTKSTSLIIPHRPFPAK